VVDGKTENAMQHILKKAIENHWIFNMPPEYIPLGGFQFIGAQHFGPCVQTNEISRQQFVILLEDNERDPTTDRVVFYNNVQHAHATRVSLALRQNLMVIRTDDAAFSTRYDRDRLLFSPTVNDTQFPRSELRFQLYANFYHAGAPTDIRANTVSFDYEFFAFVMATNEAVGRTGTFNNFPNKTTAVVSYRALLPNPEGADIQTVVARTENRVPDIYIADIDIEEDYSLQYFKAVRTDFPGAIFSLALVFVFHDSHSICKFVVMHLERELQANGTFEIVRKQIYTFKESIPFTNHHWKVGAYGAIGVVVIKYDESWFRLDLYHKTFEYINTREEQFPTWPDRYLSNLKNYPSMSGKL
jgi:hypothetical protein